MAQELDDTAECICGKAGRFPGSAKVSALTSTFIQGLEDEAGKVIVAKI